MAKREWNHNIHYHDVLLRAIPSHYRCALDVGCGQGLLARHLAQYCDQVIALDAHRESLSVANAAIGSETHVTFVEGDVMTYPFRSEKFDFISVVATLHHLPLTPALERLRDLLRPGGVLAIIGLYRSHTIEDYVLAAVALPVSLMLHRLNRYVDVGAPMREPRETLGEIRKACRRILPGAAFQRRLLFRYSVIWQKP